jgi:NAD(P)-dependent dehydrogenase (short-subunit alcohol dehydrogenase family)
MRRRWALAEHNITVNGYAPGVVVTPALGTARQGPRRDRLQGSEGQAYDGHRRRDLIIKRVSYPDDIKGTAAFLCQSTTATT